LGGGGDQEGCILVQQVGEGLVARTRREAHPDGNGRYGCVTLKAIAAGNQYLRWSSTAASAPLGGFGHRPA